MHLKTKSIKELEENLLLLGSSNHPHKADFIRAFQNELAIRRVQCLDDDVFDDTAYSPTYYSADPHSYDDALIEKLESFNLKQLEELQDHFINENLPLPREIYFAMEEKKKLLSFQLLTKIIKEYNENKNKII